MKFINKYQTRVKDINSTVGMSIAVAAVYFLDAIKDNEFDKNITNMSIDAKEILLSVKNIMIETVIVSTTSYYEIKQKMFDEDYIYFHAVSKSII